MGTTLCCGVLWIIFVPSPFSSTNIHSCSTSWINVIILKFNVSVLFYFNTLLASWIRYNRTFTEDDKCECDCIVKATDCLPRQTYSKDNCQCECNLSAETCPSGRHVSVHQHISLKYHLVISHLFHWKQCCWVKHVSYYPKLNRVRN